MKKSLLALAVLGAYAGIASAQSSVTLFGTVDLNGRYVKNDGQSRRLGLSQDGINSSQLGFRGIEDLGGGLRAGFTLLAGVNADTGTSNAKFWNRRSTVSLLGGFGEVRLGRDYTPTFWNQTIFDAFGTNGLGDSTGVRQLYGGTRMDNSIGYFLPTNLGGFYGQAMVAAGEGGTTLDRPGRYLGARVGFAAGPFDVAVAASEQRFDTSCPLGLNNGTNVGTCSPAAVAVTTALRGNTQKTYNVGGSFDFGFFKLLGYYDRETLNSLRETMGSVSGVLPFGQSEIHLGYDRSKLKLASGASTTVDKIKATYQYNLSKRTAMYATAASLDNKNNTRLSLPGGNGPLSLRGKSQGAEFGIRHFF